jgi:hypothetical protein
MFCEPRIHETQKNTHSVPSTMMTRVSFSGHTENLANVPKAFEKNLYLRVQ